MIETPKTTTRDLCAVRETYERGLYLQAYHLALGIGPLHAWRGTEARILAGRLAGNLGSSRLAACHWLRAYREDPLHADAALHYARAILSERGPLPAWEFMQQHGVPETDSSEILGDWWAHGAVLLAQFRDFDRAQTWIDEAQRIRPDDAWLVIEHAVILQIEDRHEESLAVTRRALELSPWYRPAVQMCAGMLVLRGNDEEALALLEQSLERLESYAVVLQLAGLQRELERHEEARASVELAAVLSPLRDKDFEVALAAMRSGAAYLCGDVERAATYARQARRIRFFEIIADRLGAADEITPRVRKVLPVGFVAQHHVTCAPATLSMISAYWSRPVDHLELAERICYDGTSNDSERQWAEDNGWVSAEFTVTLESAQALIDRGVPFTLTTVEPGYAHLQAVIGYDTRRGSLLIRDPSSRSLGEMLGQEMLERYRAVGPRGHALVPASEAARLSGLDLPDRTLYDLYHRLQRALVTHRRDNAAAILEQMTAADASHRLTLNAELSIARYDGDTEQALAVVDRLLVLYEDDPTLLLAKLACLAELGRRETRLEIFARMLGKKDCPALFWQQYAQELIPDARRHPEAQRMLRRALRSGVDAGGTLYVLANILWAHRAFERATELYRFAACSEDKKELYARAFFDASRAIGREGEATQLLRDRFERLGDRSGLPARSLAAALEAMGRTPDALRVLEEGIRRRPADGFLRLIAAQSYGQVGDFTRAMQLVEQADGKTSRVDWLRASAAVLTLDCRHAEAMRRWREVLELDPLCIEAHHALSQILAETEGGTAARAHLEEACAQFPSHRPLALLLLERLRDLDIAAMEPVLRRLLEMAPDDAWSHRELAVTLVGLGREDEARAVLADAHVLEPMSPSYWAVLGDLEERGGNWQEAQVAFRRAVELDVDNEYAIAGLLRQAPDRERRLADLEFLWTQQQAQTVQGPGVLVVFGHAVEMVPTDEVITRAGALRRRRPEVWEAWSAEINVLLWANRAADALPCADEATRRFPLIPRLFLDLARVHRALRDDGAEIEALEIAQRINQDYTSMTCHLAEAYRRAGRADEAQRCLERAVERTPLDATLHIRLAALVHEAGDAARATALLDRAIELDPTVERAWGLLATWTGAEDPQLSHVVESARRAARAHPGLAAVWMNLAGYLGNTAASEECLAALDRASTLAPLDPQPYRLKAQILAQHGRLDDALGVCATTLQDGLVPPSLRLEAARIEFSRGETETAIAGVEALVADEPEHAEAWQQLAEWQRSLGRIEAYLAAAGRRLELAPNDATALAMVAEAKLRGGERDVAKGLFLECLRGAPDFQFVAETLFHLHLEDREHTAAEAVLATNIEPFDAAAGVLPRLLLACSRGDRQEAIERFDAACRAPLGEEEFGGAIQILADAGWERDVAKALERAIVSEGPISPEVGYWYVRTTGSGLTGRRSRKITAILERPDIGTRGLTAWLEVLLDDPLAGPSSFVRRYQKQLEADRELSALAGAVLARCGRRSAARHWLASWTTWELTPGALNWLQLAFAALGDDASFAAVLERCRALPIDERFPVLDLWCAFDDALAGRYDDAAALLARFDGAPDDGYLRILYTITAAVTEAGCGAATGDHGWFARVRRALSSMLASERNALAAPELRRAYRRCVRAIAQHRGGVAAALWSAREMMGSMPSRS